MQSASRSLASPLANRTYRHLYLAQISALTGTGVMTVGLALLAYRLAGDDAGAVLGIALSLRIVAFVLISPLFGAYAHLLPRRRMLVALDLLRAATVLLLPFVDAVWHVYALIFLINACSAGFTPLFQATIPDILPDEALYTRALSLSRLAYDLQQLLAPALAGLLLWFLPLEALFAVNGAAFLISAALVLSVALPGAREVIRPEGALANIGWGIRLYLATPRLRGLLALSMAVAAASAMVIVNTVVYVRDVLGGGDTLVTVAYAAAGAGSMFAALLLPRVLDRIAERTAMLAGGALMAVGMAAGMTMPALAGLLAIWFVIGIGSSLVQTPGGRLLRRSAQEEDRPTLFAAQFALSHACWLLTYLVAGVVGNAIGPMSTFGLLGLLVVVASGLALRLWPAPDPELLEHEHAAVQHEHLHRHDEHHQHEHEGWEGPEPHRHPHRHRPVRHRHRFVIDLHHQHWPA
ncbi:MAG TPA: MFS transporter [Geminicoccaceae bacterium]|nr:MFS transporter [Geminicoccaceae bacterium]